MTVPKRQRIATLGEALLVLRAPTGDSLETASHLEVLLGGAECNVAIGCSRLGLEALWIGKVQDDPIGRNLVRRLRSEGVDVSHVVWSRSHRTGIMFSETGIYPRPNRVVYDRAASAATALSEQEVEWEAVRTSTHLHLTGITAALGEASQRILLRAAQEAKSAGATVSYDVNHRAKMWGPEEARRFYQQLNPWIDILFVNLEETKVLLAAADDDPDELLHRLHDRWGRPVTVLALGERGSRARVGDDVYSAPGFVVERINRFGAGDAYVAAFLSRYLRFRDVEDALRHGGAAAALKMTFSAANHPMFTAAQVSHLVRYGLVQEGSSTQAQSYSVER